MKVLHINVNAINSMFHLTYLKGMKESGVESSVFTPYSIAEHGRYVDEVTAAYSGAGVELKLAAIKNKSDRLLYNKKIHKYFKTVQQIYDCASYEVYHAHSLYSDGGVALELHKKYNKPYVVAVRSTDTSVFMKYFFWLNNHARETLEKAAKVIFISASLKEETIKSLYGGAEPPWIKNSIVIPNGVDAFWLSNTYTQRTLKRGEKIRIIQVGRLVSGKNTDKSILAIKELVSRGIDVELSIAGDGPETEKLEKLIKDSNLEAHVKLLGFISDKEILLSHYREADIFLLPSQNETFGISYIEAMTQGLPIIGVIGTGVSAYFKDARCGAFIDKPESTKIADAVENIVGNYEEYSKNSIIQSMNFDWNKIVDIYLDIYGYATNTVLEKTAAHIHEFELKYTAAELVENAKKYLQMPTVYVWGGLGEKVSEELVEKKKKIYPKVYTKEYCERILRHEKDNAIGIDCSGLIKNYLMGGIENFKENPMFDLNTASLLSRSIKKGAIDTLPEIEGVCLYKPGHVGIYIGEGKVIESTLNEQFGDGVICTNLSDRDWTDWFYCPYVEYKED